MVHLLLNSSELSSFPYSLTPVKTSANRYKEYDTVPVAVHNLKGFFQRYNYERIHQSLEYQTPAQVYYR
jgi:transposase InsO family protein